MQWRMSCTRNERCCWPRWPLRTRFDAWPWSLAPCSTETTIGACASATARASGHVLISSGTGGNITIDNDTGANITISNGIGGNTTTGNDTGGNITINNDIDGNTTINIATGANITSAARSASARPVVATRPDGAARVAATVAAIFTVFFLATPQNRALDFVQLIQCGRSHVIAARVCR